MKLKEFIEVKDSIYAPILLFKLESDRNIYVNDFEPLSTNFEAYKEYINKHENYEIHNIAIINYSGYFGLQICLKN